MPLQVDQRDAVGDVNDIYYDVARKRLYASVGDGHIDVIRHVNADTYEALARVKNGGIPGGQHVEEGCWL